MILSKLLRIVFFIYLILIWMTFAILRSVIGETELVNTQSLLLMSLFVLISQVLLLTLDGKNDLFILYLLITVLLYLFSRFWILMIFPEIVDFTGYRVSFDVHDTNRALLYLLLGTIAAAVGFELGTKVKILKTFNFTSPNSKRLPLYFRPWVLALTGVLLYAIEIYLDITRGRATRTGGLQGSFLYHFFRYESVVMLTLIIFFERKEKLKSTYGILLIVLIPMYILRGSFLGSRAPLYNILFISFCYLLIKEGNFRMHRKRVLIPIMMAAVGVILFPVVSELKGSWVTLGEQGTYSNPDAIFGIVRNGLEESARTDLIDQLLAISNRFVGLDYTMAIVNDKGWGLDRYVTMENALKSTVNLLFPGSLFGSKPFPDVMPFSWLIRIIYRGWPEELQRRYGSTESWFLWGISYAHFGWFGGLIAIFVVTFLLALGYQWLSNLNTQFSIYLKVWYVYSLYNWFVSCGFDTSIAWSVYGLLGWGTSLILFQFLSGRLLLRKRRKRVTNPTIAGVRGSRGFM